MQLYKTHIIHPHTHVPLIVYYNQTEGFVSFERDEKVLKAIYNVKRDLALNKQFQESLRRATQLCQTQYPLDTLRQAEQFLKKLGIEEQSIKFEKVLLH
ncbi:MULTISPECIES: hypothetical protein [Shouchella]|uniref:Uncharacterized protein n=5 Tax=Bacillaceae TaxID=186817 RepID=A0A060M139_9BACI|nr:MULTISPECIES: hypothetical protein [Bacillaceae]RQW22022.1 hypothetical protein EH196_05775 [Bacillus sp. C1-1]GAF22530.1 hypothetical protein JCM19047_2289 [Bacillus sp. JCM 19047]AIC93799.1 hypothetical protein BleG1_1196 [Shouchella lehensis G1]KQL59081.1 hypothetical protein AN965_00110 [Alkalicoccobacillus plakortidis]MBG9782528.1 hypothetical protein [Shouchella lehensis]